MAENAVILVGNLTGNLELRFTQAGKARANCGMAVNRRWFRNEVWEEQTSFFNLVMWDELAENAVKTLVKGTRVVVSGRLEQRAWEQDGVKRTAVEVMVDDIGPSLRWATATVAKTPKKDKAPATDNAAEYQEEPF